MHLPAHPVSNSFFPPTPFINTHILIHHYRMSSSREEGWLDTKIGKANRWNRMWVVFNDGALYYSPEQPHYGVSDLHARIKCTYIRIYMNLNILKIP